MNNFIKNYVKGCDTCQQFKNTPKQPDVPIVPTETPTRPWQIVTSDFITGLPLTIEGHNAIQVIVDKFTKMAVFIPCTTQIDAEQTAWNFLNYVWVHFGLPDKIITDCSTQLNSEFFQELCDKLGIKSAMSTAYHPRTDGQTERVNQELEQFLRIAVAKEPTSWERSLPLAAHARNSQENSAIGMSPFEAMYGFAPKTILDYSPITKAYANMDKQIQDLIKRHDKVHAALDITKETIRQRGPAITEIPYQRGNSVWLNTKNLKLAVPANKFCSKWVGSFNISEVIGVTSARLELPSDWKIHNVFHMNLLKPHKQTKEYSKQYPEPAPDLINDELHYEIDKIVKSRIDKRRICQLEYRVQWKGYSSKHNTWEPAINLYPHAEDSITEFHQIYLQMPGPLTSDELALLQAEEKARGEH